MIEVNDKTPRPYHARDGLYFQRLPSGAVRLAQLYPGADPERIEKVPEMQEPPADLAALWYEILPSEWASLVAAVSAPGETGLTQALAEALHRGGA